MTKKEVTKLSYDITGFAIKVHKKLGQVYWKVFMSNV